jgi:hypothetical protein
MKTKQIFKDIEEALLVIRPGDKLVKKLSNKFAAVSSPCTNGSSLTSYVGLDNGVIYKYADVGNKKAIQVYLDSLPNIKHIPMCFNHKESGMPMHYLIKIWDYRRHKRQLRKLLTLIKTQ